MAAKKSTKIPKPAAVKEAEASLYQASLQGLEASRVRVAQQSRGAVRTRPLRSSGTDLQGYLIGGYKDDPFPKVPSGGGGTRTGGTTRRSTSKPKSALKKAPNYSRKEKQRLSQEISDARAKEMDRIRRKKAEAARKAKAAAARKKNAGGSAKTKGGSYAV
jgi:hypothetical protein